jgi:hypothetical protein
MVLALVLALALERILRPRMTPPPKPARTAHPSGCLFNGDWMPGAWCVAHSVPLEPLQPEQ